MLIAEYTKDAVILTKAALCNVDAAGTEALLSPFFNQLPNPFSMIDFNTAFSIYVLRRIRV